MRADVAALYVDPRGPYPKLVEHWYDEAKDARTYAGPWPVVAHPPCGPWGALKHLSRKDNAALGPIGVDQVRTYGGVLEHPAGSGLFAAKQMPRPGELPDAFGGWSLEVCQVDWGHVARKRTWLYVVGTRDLPTLPASREPTHWVSGGRNPNRKGSGGLIPAGMKVCSAQQRRRTPVAFAEWLLELAAGARREAKCG